MRLSLGLLLVGSVAIVACSGEDGSIRRNPTSTEAPGTGTPPTSTSPSSTPAPAPCAGVAEAKSISADKDATDIHIIAGSVVYRSGTQIVKVDPKSGARVQLYVSPDLVHSFSDEDVIVTIESPNAPDAVLKVRPAGPTTGQDPKLPTELTATPPNWSAGGTYVFGSDADSFYVLADVTNQGDTIYKVSKQNPNLIIQLASLDAPLSDAQLVGSDVWFVRDQKRVYKVTQTVDPNNPAGGLLPGTTTADPATEVFAIGYADCKLAIGGSHAFCSTGTALEQRDLSGANMLTVFDTQKAADHSPLGAVMYGGDTVFVRSLPSTTTDPVKNGIRALKSNGTTADEKAIACGRDPISGFAVDSSMVVWGEQGKGVFTAPR